MRLVDYARRTPSALLLFVQLAGLLLYPASEAHVWSRLLLEVFSVLVLFLTVRLVRDTPGLTWLSISLAVPAVVLSVIAAVTGTGALDPYYAPLLAVFYFYAAYSLLRYTLADDEVTVDEIFAAGATFTLVAWGFSYLYLFVQGVSAPAFTAALNPDDPKTWIELLYLSFTTLTSTGLSDIMPVGPWARSAVMFEMLAGVAFLAMVVSRMVALRVARARVDMERRELPDRGPGPADEASEQADDRGVVGGPS